MSSIALHAGDKTLGGLPNQPYVLRELSMRRILTVLFAFVFLQKLALPAGASEAKVQLALFMMYAMVGMLALRGIVYVSVVRLAAYCALIAIACGTRVISGTGFSVASMALFAVSYLPCVFMMRITREVFLKIMRGFVIVGLTTSCLVAFNWMTQLTGLGLPLNLDKFIPEPFIFREYMYIQPLNWGSPITKPNAVFFLETSVVSQFLALSLIIELCFFQRFAIIAVLAAGLFSTFGGTGVALLGLSGVFVLKYINRKLVISALAVTPIVIGVALSSGLVDNFLRRTSDFDRKGSSAQSRFTRPVEIVGEISGREVAPLLVGRGPGTANEDLNDRYVPAFVKTFHEYGLIFTVAWMFFMASFIWGRNVPWIMGWCSFLCYQVLNASFLVPLFVYYPLFIGGAYDVVEEDDDVDRRS